MRHLQLTEGAPAQPALLSDYEAEILAEMELAAVSRRPNSHEWEVLAGTKVGVVRLDDLQVSVQPKLPIARLVFLMGYSRRPEFWRDSNVTLDAADGLPEALAHTFARFATKAVEQGLLQGYLSVEDSLAVVRGRLRIGDQIRKRFGAALPLELSYDEFTVDIAENRLLLETTTRLLKIPELSTDVRRRLLALRVRLTGVSSLVRGQPLPVWRTSRLNVRYQPALRVAELILAGDSFEQRHGTTAVSGFVLDMASIFEDFVCVALREASALRDGSSELQFRSHLDMDRQVPIRPDFVWTGHDGARVVLDAKYKAEKPSGFPQADLYQLLAYCTVLGLPDGHLVYAKGNEGASVHEVVGSGVRIHCHTLDLDQPPDLLLDQVDGMASAIQIAARVPALR